MRPFRERTFRGIDEAARAAGFEPFGSRDAWALAYRSSSAFLTVTWDRGFFHAACEPRSGGLGFSVDDDLFRQLVDGDAADPDGVRREWLDHDAFVLFLRERLAELVRVATSADPDTRTALTALAKRRADLAQAWWDARPRAAPRGRQPKRVPPSGVVHATPIVAVALGISTLVSLLMLENRYPHRGFEAALGYAWVLVPILTTMAVLVARDWRAEMHRREQ